MNKLFEIIHSIRFNIIRHLILTWFKFDVKPVYAHNNIRKIIAWQFDFVDPQYEKERRDRKQSKRTWYCSGILYDCIWVQKRNFKIIGRQEIISTEKIDEFFNDCLFKDNENKSRFIMGRGVINDFGFHPERLEDHRNDIKELLCQLPDSFMQSKGGGMSFLCACEDKDGIQWGEHANMEKLFSLGHALKLVVYPFPKEMNPMLPGSMPYVIVVDKEGEKKWIKTLMITMKMR